jgi:hypothetical protein
MQRIVIEEVKPSMVVAITVKDKQRNILVLKGVTLTERHIQILRRNDINKVVVEGTRVNKINGGNAARAVEKRFGPAYMKSDLARKVCETLKELLG